MDKKIHTFEEFGKIITAEYISKGIKPPVPGGEKEKQLYQQWLEGKEKLKKLFSYDK